jgi:hypothetical protein
MMERELVAECVLWNLFPSVTLVQMRYSRKN